VPKAWSLGPVFTVTNSALQGGSATPRDQLYRALTQLFRAYGIALVQLGLALVQLYRA